jgi:hypothetical protein
LNIREHSGKRPHKLKIKQQEGDSSPDVRIEIDEESETENCTYRANAWSSGRLVMQQ